jgi:apolipoprotein N-acyltransferase
MMTAKPHPLEVCDWKKKEFFSDKLNILYVFLSGCVGTLGFAPFNLFPFFWLSLLLLMFFLRKNPEKGAFFGFMWGVGFY